MSATKRITVTTIDDMVYDLRIMPGDVVRCERQYGISAGDLERDPHLEHILYVSWLSAKRHAYAGSFDDWVDQVTDLDIGAEDPANPTPPAP